MKQMNILMKYFALNYKKCMSFRKENKAEINSWKEHKSEREVIKQELTCELILLKKKQKTKIKLVKERKDVMETT